MKNNTIGVLFICLGNICRSPSAQVIFESIVKQNKLSHAFKIDSCGTAAFNIGKSPDKRAIKACKALGYNIEHLIARQLNDEDYSLFDYLIVMDRKNMMSVKPWQPKDFTGKTELLMHFHPETTGNMQISDPYQDDESAFLPTMKTIEKACLGLFEHIIFAHELN